MYREEIEWCELYWFDTNGDPELPRVLLVGDSIVAATRYGVAHKMAGAALVATYSTSKIVGDPAIYRELALALGDYPIDLVYFNNGLHGFEYDDAFYRRTLGEFADFLRQSTRARLVWRHSTPVTLEGKPDTPDEPKDGLVVRRNRIAEEVMRARGIPVDDLYSVLAGRAELRSLDGCHYNEKGNEAIAEHTAATLRRELAHRHADVESR